MKIDREKNWYIITRDNDNKTIKFNFATGECIGVSGRTLKNVAKEARFLDIIKTYGDNNSNNPYKEFIDRLISLKPLSDDTMSTIFNNLTSYNRWVYDVASLSDLLYNKAEWRNFLAYLRTVDESEIIQDWAIVSRLIKGYQQYIYLQNLNCSDSLKKILLNCSPATVQTEIGNKLFKKLINTLEKSMESIYNLHNLFENSMFISYDSLIEWVQDFYSRNIKEINNIDELLKKYPSITINTKLDIEDLKNDVKRQAKILENQEAQKRFAETQTNGNLAYENERYKIYVPTTYDDCQKIGKYFHNCAGGFEWEQYLKTEIRYLVVVINKIDNTPVVCCDIDMNSRQIKQYLATCNRKVTDKELKLFKIEYQDFLKR